MRADSIVVSDSLIGGSLLIAERIQNRRFPTVVLKRITDGESCKVSMGEGVVIPVDREMATETLDMLEQLERMNRTGRGRSGDKKNQFILRELRNRNRI